MKEKKLTIFFDFDGTLIDVKSKYYQIYADFIAGYNGICLGLEEFWALKRAMGSNEDICAKSGLLKQLGSELKEFTKQNIEKEKYLTLDTPFIDTFQILDYLQQKQATVNIISMRRNTIGLENQIIRFGISRYITNIYAPHAILGATIIEGDSLSKSHAITSLGINNNKAIIVGDTGTDLSSAKHLGWQSVAVLTGLRNREEIEKYQPNYIIDQLIDLRNIIEKHEHTLC